MDKRAEEHRRSKFMDCVSKAKSLAKQIHERAKASGVDELCSLAESLRGELKPLPRHVHPTQTALIEATMENVKLRIDVTELETLLCTANAKLQAYEELTDEAVDMLQLKDANLQLAGLVAQRNNDVVYKD